MIQFGQQKSGLQYERGKKMKKLLMLNVMPHIIIDVIGWVLFSFAKEMDIVFKVGAFILLSQYVIVLPLYYVATLAVAHFKYNLDVLKGFILQLIVLFLSRTVFVAISAIFMYFIMGDVAWTFSDAMKLLIGTESAIACLSPALAVMVPGTIVIAVVSYVRKKKQTTAEKNDTEEI